MKKISFFGFIMILAIACSPAKKTAKTPDTPGTEVKKENPVTLEKKSQDSTQYELIIYDIRFDQWYLTNFNPSKDRTNEYYHYKNNIAAANWNDYFRSAKYGNVVESLINYFPDIDYGIDINRRLFWYFRYVESEYGIKLF